MKQLGTCATIGLLAMLLISPAIAPVIAQPPNAKTMRLYTNGPLTLAESGAIIEYVVGRYGADRLAPALGTVEHVRYLYWLHYAEGSMMPPLLMRLVFNRIANAPMPFFVKPVARGIAQKANDTFIGPQLKLHLDYLEGELGNSEWFAGREFSAADIQMSYPLVSAETRIGLGGHPKTQDLLARIRARPAFQRAQERGGKLEVPSFKQ